MATIISLSIEIITLIGDYLPDKELAHLSQTDGFFNQILAKPLLARALEDKPPPVVKIHALLWAITNGHTGLVRTIVSQPMFTKYHGGISQALDLAAQLGHSEMIPILIEAGYDVNGDYATSPLHSAALNGHPAAVTKLIDLGAHIHRKDKRRKTVLRCAIEASRVLWEKIGPKDPSGKDDRQLVYEIEARVIAIIKILLQRGGPSQLQARNRRGDTALHFAVQYCIESAVNDRAGSGILRFLVQAGAPLRIRNKEDNTPLDLAVTYPTASPTALTFFLDMGMSPDSLHFDGSTLLEQAIFCDKYSWPILQILLRRGASGDSINLLNFLAHAIDRDPVLIDNTLTLLLIHGATLGTPSEAGKFFSYAALRGMLGVMETVLESCPGANINGSPLENSSMGTPLYSAITNGRVDMVRLLVRHGVKMTEQEEKHVTDLLADESMICAEEIV